MSKANLLDRRQVVSTLLADRKDVVAIGGLGASTNDICAPATTPATSISGAGWAARR